jgi:hypothetical protein
MPYKMYRQGKQTIVEGVPYAKMRPVLQRYPWYGLGSKRCYVIQATEGQIRHYLNKMGVNL